jgi:hypothetical protein
MWESQRDFHRVWEAGFLAFRVFHTLSFPWPALETCIRKSKLPITPFPGRYGNHLSGKPTILVIPGTMTAATINVAKL